VASLLSHLMTLEIFNKEHRMKKITMLLIILLLGNLSFADESGKKYTLDDVTAYIVKISKGNNSGSMNYDSF